MERQLILRAVPWLLLLMCMVSMAKALEGLDDDDEEPRLSNLDHNADIDATADEVR